MFIPPKSNEDKELLSKKNKKLQQKTGRSIVLISLNFTTFPLTQFDTIPTTAGRV